MESSSPTEPTAPAPLPPTPPRRRRHRTRRPEPQIDRRQLAILSVAFVGLVFVVFNRGAKDALRGVIHRFLPALQGVARPEIFALALVGLTVLYLMVPQADQKLLKLLGVGRPRRRRRV